MADTRAMLDREKINKSNKLNLRFRLLNKAVNAKMQSIALEVLQGIADNSFNDELLKSQQHAYIIFKTMILQNMTHAVSRYLDCFENTPSLLIGPDMNDFECLYHAAAGDTKIFIDLLNKIKLFDPDLQCLEYRHPEDGSTILHSAVKNIDAWKIIPIILKLNPNLVKAKDLNLDTAFSIALKYSALNAAMLINRGAALGEKDVAFIFQQNLLFKLLSYLSDAKKRYTLNIFYNRVITRSSICQKHNTTLMAAIGMLSLRQLIIAKHEILGLNFNRRTQLEFESRSVALYLTRNGSLFEKVIKGSPIFLSDFLRNSKGKIIFNENGEPNFLYKTQKEIIELPGAIASELPRYAQMCAATNNDLLLNADNELDNILKLLMELIINVRPYKNFDLCLRYGLLVLGIVVISVMLYIAFNDEVKQTLKFSNMLSISALVLLASALISAPGLCPLPARVVFSGQQEKIIEPLLLLKQSLEGIQFYNETHKEKIHQYSLLIEKILEKSSEVINNIELDALLVEMQQYFSSLQPITLSQNRHSIFYHAQAADKLITSSPSRFHFQKLT